MANEATKPVDGGAVLLARALLDSDVWKMPAGYVKLWVYILTKARWDTKPHTIGTVTIGYGEVLKSYRVIADENAWMENRRERKWSTSAVGRMLAWFECEEMIRTLGTDLGTLIHVRNFKRYQDFATYARQLGTEVGTTGEQPENNRKQEYQGVVDATAAPTEKVSTPDELASGIIEYTNRCMAENVTIDQHRLRPIHTSHGSRSFVVEWLTEGIPPETIYETVGDIARHQARNRGEQFYSMAYFDKPVREAHARELNQQQAQEAVRDGTVVDLSTRKRGRPSGPRRWPHGTPTDDFDPGKAAS